MRLVRYNPLNELAALTNSFNDFFTNPQANGESKDWYPAVDILDQADSIELRVDLPGVHKEDIAVNIEEKLLTISGERKSETPENENTFSRKECITGSFKRSFKLSDDLITDEVDAGFKDGVLKVTLKKNKTKEEVKQITIN
ncbi:MAG: Hsp20/alpha crystallin family protein [Desulfobacteraceae bacterium]|nr:Hsp20/alpha crystallin family protein [Desulfobacteraceae bacterium]